MSEETTHKQKAYILIRSQPGKELDVYEELKDFPNISSIDFVYGAFDFIIVAEGEKDAVENVILRARRIPHVLGTETMLAFRESFPWEDISGRI